MKKFLTSDTAWKIYSVLIAIVLWCVVVVNENPDSTREVEDIPITIVNHDALEQAGLAYVQNEDLTMDLKVSGRRLAIAKAERVLATVTVPNIRVGTYDLPIEIQPPSNDIRIVSKSRDTVRVVVERRVEKAHTVEVVINGVSEDERMLYKTQLDATSVLLTGPQSVIERVGRVYVSINKNDAGKKIKADLIIEDRRGDNITQDANIGKSFDAVNLSLTKLTSAKTAVEAVLEGAPAEKYAVLETVISPDTVLLGAATKSDSWLETVKTLPISVEGKTADFTERVELDVPDGYELLEEKTTVQVTVKIGPATEQ